MKNQALFSSKDKSNKLKCHLLQILFGPLRVKSNTPSHQFYVYPRNTLHCMQSSRHTCIHKLLADDLILTRREGQGHQSLISLAQLMMQSSKCSTFPSTGSIVKIIKLCFNEIQDSKSCAELESDVKVTKANWVL